MSHSERTALVSNVFPGIADYYVESIVNISFQTRESRQDSDAIALRGLLCGPVFAAIANYDLDINPRHDQKEQDFLLHLQKVGATKTGDWTRTKAMYNKATNKAEHQLRSMHLETAVHSRLKQLSQDNAHVKRNKLDKSSQKIGVKKKGEKWRAMANYGGNKWISKTYTTVNQASIAFDAHIYEKELQGLYDFNEPNMAQAERLRQLQQWEEAAGH